MGSKDKQSKKLRNEEASKHIKNMQSQKKKEKEQRMKLELLIKSRQEEIQKQKLEKQIQQEEINKQKKTEKNRKKREKKKQRMIRKQQKQNGEEEMKTKVLKIVRTKEEERKAFLEGLTPHERRRAIQENEEILKQAYTKEVYKILPKSHPNLGMYEENEDKQEQLDNSAGIVLGD